jgi:disulfide oxidoreductase YuzD
MIDIVNYFNDNKKNILDRIEEEKYIFPKMFLNEVELIHDSDLYKTASNDPTFGNLFLIEQIRIFNIERIKDIYAFKSDKKYKIICLPFSTFEMAYLNDKQIKDQLFVNYNSEKKLS